MKAIDIRSMLIGVLTCACLFLIMGLTEKDGSFDTIVANKILIGDKDNPLIEITKDYDDGSSGLILLNNKKGFTGIALTMLDNDGYISIDTNCDVTDPDDPECSASLMSLGGDELGGLVSIYQRQNRNALFLGVAVDGAMIEAYDGDEKFKSYKNLVNKHIDE